VFEVTIKGERGNEKDLSKTRPWQGGDLKILKQQKFNKNGKTGREKIILHEKGVLSCGQGKSKKNVRGRKINFLDSRHGCFGPAQGETEKHTITLFRETTGNTDEKETHVVGQEQVR